jgi:hypothetical protein
MQNMTPQARQEMFTTQGEAKDAANKPLPELKLLDGVGQAKGTDAAPTPEANKPEPGKTDAPTQPGAPRSDAPQTPEANKPEGTKPEAARPEAPTQPGAPRSDAPQTPEANKPEPGKTDAPTQPGAPRSDAPQTPEANKPEPGKTDAPTQPGAPRSDAPQTPEAAKPEGPQKPEAPTTPAEEGPMSPKLQRGEGPYQAFKRQHPEWDHKKLMEESGKILKETGRKEFRQGEQFRNNPDGSVTIREESRKRDGTFTETTSKDGRKVEEKRGDDKGNWSSQKYDENGKLVTSKTHQVSENGTVDTSTDSKGKQTDRYSPEGKHTSSIRKNNDGSAAGWHKDKDGGTTTIEQPDANHRTEKHTDKDGNPTGSKRITIDKDGELTDSYDKDGKQTGTMRQRPDGSATGWEKNPDGSIKTIEQPDKANRTETTTKDGKTIREDKGEITADGIKHTQTDKDGTRTRTWDKSQRSTSDVLTKPDGSAKGWRINGDGSKTEIDQPDKDHRTEITRDKDGKEISKMQRETTADGAKETVTDDNGTKTTNFDKEGKKVSGKTIGKDGKETGWEARKDGTVMSYEQPDKDHRKETISKDGNMISEKSIESSPNGRKEITRDKESTTTNNFDKDGKAIAGHIAKPDGSAMGWHNNPDGSVTGYVQPNKDHRQEITKKDGQIINGRELKRDKDGVTTDEYNANKEQTSHQRLNNDGSANGWTRNPDGSITNYDKPKAGKMSTRTQGPITRAA